MSSKLIIKKTSLCVGDLNRKITLQNRDIQPPQFGSADFTEEFSNLKSIFAALETPTGKVVFDGLNVERVVTHVFYIRYLSSVSTETWILFKGKRFEIIKMKNLEESDSWLALMSSERGSTDLGAANV